METLGTLKTPVKFKDWQIPKTKISVVADGFRPILGGDLFDQLGIKITQTPCPKVEINTIEAPGTIKRSRAKEFPEFITRIGIPKHHTVNLKLHRN